MGVVTNIRNTITKQIALSPATITVEKYPLIDNGYGIEIPDVTQTPVVETLGTGKVSRRRLPDPLVTDNKSPYDYQDVYYLIVEYDADWLRRGLIFTYHDKKFRTLFVEDRIVQNEVVYRLCDLEQVNTTNGGVMYE